MDLARSTTRLELLTPASLGYRLRALCVFITRSGKLVAWCELAAGWMLCAAVFAAPWMSAGIDPWAIRVIAVWLSCSAGLWAVAHWYRRPIDLPLSLRLLAGVVAVIGLLGVAAVLHTTNAFQPVDLVLVKPLATSNWLPSTVYRRGTAEWLVQVGPVLAALVVMADLFRSLAWMRRFVAALALSGAAVAAYGCLRHVHLVPALVFPEASDVKFPETVFAAFRKHGNAGAWLNLALPAAIGMALLSSGRTRVAWIVAAAVITVGGLVNVSKIASVFTIGIVVTSAIALLARRQSHDWRAFAGQAFKIVIVPALLLLAFAWTTGRFHAWHNMLATVGGDSGRGIIWRASAHMARDSGAFGYGAGTFKVLLPTTAYLDHTRDNHWAVTRYTPGTPISQWMYPCNDLLQSLIEWGPAGTALGLMIPTGAAAGLIAGRRRQLDATRHVVAGVSLLALAVVAVHAMGDYPLQILSIQLAVSVYLAIGWSMLASPKDRFVVVG